MNHETTSDDLDIIILEWDGSKSEPITPRSPSEQARLEKVREKYVKAGLIPAVIPTNDELTSREMHADDPPSH